jgi:hypothetical protein
VPIALVDVWISLYPGLNSIGVRYGTRAEFAARTGTIVISSTTPTQRDIDGG